MRTCAFVSLAVAIVLAGGASTLPRAGAEQKPALISRSYTHAGLTDITVKDGKLRYVWHTLRLWEGKVSPTPSDLDEYDRHQVDVWLTDKELHRFRDWVAQHKVFRFDKEYPSSSDRRSYGAAFHSSLTVSQGDKKHTVSWVGDSKTPRELDTAIRKLNSLVAKIEKSRRK
jgi:hypothetical protein